MGDRSYMVIEVQDCPGRKRRIAQLLAEYDLSLNRWDPQNGPVDDPGEVETGIGYTVDEISLGSAAELADRLIVLAPRCSFYVRQDPHYSSARGDLIAYTPKLGRFDGECDGSGTVVRDFREITGLLDQAERAGIGGDLGQRAVIEIAYGVPWLNDWTEIDPDRVKRKLWFQVIDAAEADAARRRQVALDDLLGGVSEFGTWAVNGGLAGRGLAAEAQIVRETPVPAQFDAARVLQDACTARLAEVAARLPDEEARRRMHAEHRRIGYALGQWAGGWQIAWQGRRRP